MNLNQPKFDWRQGLKDLRLESPTYGLSNLLQMKGEDVSGIIVPPGVGHGFCFTEPTTLVFAVSAYWQEDDELCCIWNDPELGIHWPVTNPLLSVR